ncbi:MAG: ribonuclease E/G, partial [Devosiaceae bacterium]|nr:ribonuclease E/G [Devosiaceae bacterium]
MTTKKRMLVDASHPEETRIVVTSSNRLDEFDFESANRRQLRGNIYLAKVTRVEPSLQAAFVDYGGNRHGFLAFSEIHPDYYQIPQADRQALLEAEAKAIKLEAELAEKAAKKAKDKKKKATKAAEAEKAESVTEEADLSDDGAAETAIDDADAPASDVEKTDESTQNQADTAQEAEGETTPESKTASETEGEADSNPDTEAADDDAAEDDAGEDENFDDLGGGEGEDLLEVRRKQIRRYKIQEVIRRGQVLLIQVVKEERGNKGAALTTYLSLAGRYSVLMPNTARGGGISRKITSGSDRKRLKQIASDLEVPQGMGVILRTAGASRTKAEIKRDFEYLSRLWENVRQLTMKSNAPSLVYEEGSLIKRTIRDLYTKDISEVLVSGDTAFREAKDFMQLIMPSHAKNVKLHKESQNLFSRYNVEAQLDSMFSPQVTLPSGGYIVINPTE